MPQGRSLAISCNYDFLIKSLVYDGNHYFDLGPILKPKPILADTFRRYRNRYRTTFQRENLMGYFFHHKRAPKPNLLPNIKDFQVYFWRSIVQLQAFKNLYNPKKQENTRKIKNFEKKGLGFWKKRVSAPILKLDFGFGSRYRNLVSVFH